MQGRRLKAGSKADNMEGFCIKACSPWFGHPASYTTQQHLPRGAVAHSGWSHSESIINYVNAPTDLLTSKSDRGIFTTVAPSLFQTASLCQVKKN